MSPLLDLQYRLEYVILRVVVGFFRLLPLDFAAGVSARLWRLLAPLTPRHKRALENLALAFPEKSESERRTIALEHWDNLGRVSIEGMQLDRLLAQEGRIELADAHLLSRYQGRFGPAVGVTLHTGNWELAVWPLARYGGQPAAIYRLIKNPYVDAYVREQRRQLYPGGLLAKGKAHGSNAEGQRTARLITDYVRKGGRLGIVCDLYDKSGIAVPFFGHPAKSTPVPAMIARRVGARIWMARAVRIARQSRFRIEVKELKVPRSGNPGDDIRAITAAMHAQFEAWVRERPEQWMWSNRRWS
ncbi:MAG: lipid A biosynthesis acyltransferase [Rhizobiales bacterium]|nr:lipid A biosynthesis acyltransferase [Hyphomicrobiales bacterium]